MSEKQNDLIRTLAAERDLTALSDVQQAYLARVLAGEVVPSGGRGGGASRIIDALFALPRKPAPEAVEVPAGRYAVELGGRNVVEFFRVDRPTEGKWAGWTFVKQQASDDEWPVKGARKTEVLAAIAIDPQAALLLYGQEIGSCGNCGRTLTDDISREMGIGPDCAAHLGIDRPKPASRRRSAPAAQEAPSGTPASPAVIVTQGGPLTELPGETWNDIFGVANDA